MYLPPSSESEIQATDRLAVVYLWLRQNACSGRFFPSRPLTLEIRTTWSATGGYHRRTKTRPTSIQGKENPFLESGNKIEKSETTVGIKGRSREHHATRTTERVCRCIGIAPWVHSGHCHGLWRCSGICRLGIGSVLSLVCARSGDNKGAVGKSR